MQTNKKHFLSLTNYLHWNIYLSFSLSLSVCFSLYLSFCVLHSLSVSIFLSVSKLLTLFSSLLNLLVSPTDLFGNSQSCIHTVIKNNVILNMTYLRWPKQYNCTRPKLKLLDSTCQSVMHHRYICCAMVVGV